MKGKSAAIVEPEMCGSTVKAFVPDKERLLRGRGAGASAFAHGEISRAGAVGTSRATRQSPRASDHVPILRPHQGESISRRSPGLHVEGKRARIHIVAIQGDVQRSIGRG